MTFTEIVQLAGTALFIVFIFFGAFRLWDAVWEWIEKRKGTR